MKIQTCRRWFLITGVFFCLYSTAFSYSGGSGTADDPYQIATVSDWQQFMNTRSDWNKCFLLTADLDLGAVSITPIDESYSLIFDGGNHIIRNINIINVNGDWMGLFGFIGANCQIRNLGLENVFIESGNNEWVGSLAGRNAGSIVNCHSSGSLISLRNQWTGGLVGFNEDGDINNCYADVFISGGSPTGGLVGRNQRYRQGGIIINCHSSGTIISTTSSQRFGGLVGHNYNGGINNCYSNAFVSGDMTVGGLAGSNDNGSICNSYATGDVIGWNYVGGLVGENHYSTISGCYATGVVNGTNGGENIGGLVGENENSTIKNCYASGIVNVTNGSNSGGLTGDNTQGTIKNCYSVCRVVGNTNGGLVGGWRSGSNVAGSFWDITVSGCSTSRGGLGLPTYLMKSVLTYQYASWDGNDWVINDGNDYPHLVWENTGGQPIPEPVPPSFAGSGTEQDPYQISSADDLILLNWYGADARNFYVLTTDLDLSGILFYPIGSYSGFSFGGSFDGNGHIIHNININLPNSNNIGLFSNIDFNGQIRNLGLDDVNITGDNSVGGLAGENDGNIINCCVTGAVNGNGNYIGGLTGLNNGNITACYTTGAANGGGNCVGGLAGENTGFIINCYSTDTANGHIQIGGLAGYNANIVKNCYSTGIVAGYDYVGGFTGQNDGNVIFSFWDINTSGQATSAGGAGLTTSQMKSVITYQYARWDGNDWIINDGNDYPHLAWENTNGEPIPGPLPPPFAGSGTEQDPYRISTIDDFKLLNEYFYMLIFDKHIILTADLDLSGSALSPIGKYYGSSFKGVFDGNGHIIRNININLPNSNNIGLFSIVDSNGQIRNLGLEDVNVIGNNYVGGLAGINDGNIISCYVTGIINGSGSYCGGLTGKSNKDISECYFNGTVNGNSNYVGGITGYNYLGLIIDCYADCNVHSFNNYVGGLAGNNDGGTITACNAMGTAFGSSYVGGLTATNSGSISNCFAIGTVLGDYDYVGGLIGVNWGNINSCYSKGTANGGRYSVGGLVGQNSGGVVIDSYSMDDANGATQVGGLIGYNNNIITNCYSTGTAAGNNQIGGLIGQNDGNAASVNNCFAIGTVLGDYDCVGGLIGLNYGKISTCYSKGTANGGRYAVGGLVGENYGGVVINSYSTDTVDGFAQVGGLVGYNNNIVTNCYSTGTATGNNPIGGLIGQNDGNAASCFWDVNTSGQMTSDGGEGKTTDEMQTLLTFTNAGWDFSYKDGNDAIWYMPIDDYPILTWQISPADIYTDGKNNFMDFATFAQYWMRKDCRMYNDYCDFADLNFDGKVDYEDLFELMSYWLEEGIYD